MTCRIQPAGQTSLSGQVLDEDGKPVNGALVKLFGLQATTDDDGNFLLPNPPAGPDQLLLVDGGPASTPEGSYAIIPYKVPIVAGQANTLGFTPHLHFQKTTGLVDISNSSVQRVVTDPEVPGFQMTIPAGSRSRGGTGSRTPGSPSGRSPPTGPASRPSPRTATPPLYMYYFGKQGGGTPSVPIPITFPNDLDLPPGTQVELRRRGRGVRRAKSALSSG